APSSGRPRVLVSSASLPPPPFSALFPYTTLFRSGICTLCRQSDTYKQFPCLIIIESAPCIRIFFFQALNNFQRALFLCHVYSPRSEEHTSELQSRFDLVCRLLLGKKKKGMSSLSR